MIDWSRYYLKDIPFLSIPAIRIHSKDKRRNGKLYYSKFVERQINEMVELIESQYGPFIFLRTKGSTLGNGKSAFLAHIYWKLKKKGANVLWAVARDDPRLTSLLSSVLDAFVADGKLSKLKESIQPINSIKIREYLNKTSNPYRSRTVNSLETVLKEDETKFIYKYSIIKRSSPTQDHSELFGAILTLASSIGESNFVIFIDQFEEYVLSHQSSSQINKLGHELNDLQREIGEIATFVVSTHPEATNKIMSSTPEAETFTNVGSSSVDLPMMTREELLEMIALYFEEFRVDDYSEEIFHPFQKDVIEYAAERTNLIPRGLILSLRAALIYAAITDTDTIDGNFVEKYHQKIFGGYENKWKDFKKGKWKYELV